MTDKTTPSGGPRRRRKGYYPGSAVAGTGNDAAGSPKASAKTGGRPVPAAATPTVAEDGESITADRVDVTRAAVGRVDSSDVSVRQGAIGAARADRIEISQGALGAALAGEVTVERGYARTVLAREVEMEQSLARTVIAGEVHARQSIIAILLARRVEGDVRVLLDWRGALAFGVAAGVIGGLMARVRGARPVRKR